MLRLSFVFGIVDVVIFVFVHEVYLLFVGFRVH